LKEAALDSPTFRATAIHFGQQIDVAERWLEGYVRSASKLSHEAIALENIVNSFISASLPPQAASEAIIDHDYTTLAIQRYGECAKEFWLNAIRGMKKAESSVVEPIRTFLGGDIRNLRESRKNLEHCQKDFDTLISRFAGQAKTKEASSLREDAFQLHESRKAYLKASMDFCMMAPQVRASLDKLLVKVFSDQWREMRSSRDTARNAMGKWGPEMDRVKGWSREMENGERIFKRELHMARKQIEESAEQAIRPSRELEDYSVSTVPYLNTPHSQSTALNSPAKPVSDKSEKQGWLFQRTIYGKPARTIWIRRWYFVKNGIVGWLATSPRSGAVEESDKIGVLLCGIRPAVQEERRFCFEVKTKDTTILLQAESQPELMEWISTFEMAKRKALEDPASTEHGDSQSGDLAFAITPPVAPEFAAKNTDGHASHNSDELLGFERSNTLAPDRDGMGGLQSRTSFDVTKRSGTSEREGERTRDRIIEKLDLHRKPAAPQPGPTISSSLASSGIASLIGASHTMFPGGSTESKFLPSAARTSSLAPSTLANPPAPTNLSKAAVVLCGERGVSLGQGAGGMPGGLMANLWGSSNWGHVNRLERGEVKIYQEKDSSQTPSPSLNPDTNGEKSDDLLTARNGPSAEAPGHRKTVSIGETPRSPRPSVNMADDYPNYYPLPLKAQDAQFRFLFPDVPRKEKVVLVFRATWNPNEQQEFPGRVYVTCNEIYFYSHHLGLVLITGVHLSVIDEVTAAPGRDCDYLYLHMEPDSPGEGPSRVTIKVFLEPMKLLQRRLNFLVENSKSSTPLPIDEVIKALLKMEVTGDDDDHDGDGWEEPDTPVDGAADKPRQDVKASLRIDGNIFSGKPGIALGKNATKFKLPTQPVVFAPPGMMQTAAEKEFDISAKALFHVLFGDKSAMFQLLYCERWAESITQTPWSLPEQGRHRRELEVRARIPGNKRLYDTKETQIIDILNDHLCYVVTAKREPFYLPYSKSFLLVTKFVITHVTKSRCKFAIFHRVEWTKPAPFVQRLVEGKALRDLLLDSADILDVVVSQVQKLGNNSRTRKATQIFGNIGQQKEASQCFAKDLPPSSSERKLKIKNVTVLGLMVKALQIRAVNAVLAIVSGLIAVIGALMKVFTGHAILTLALILSGCFNMLHTSRDAGVWWEERSAQRFMRGLGVGPNTMMSRAVYLRDIDEILTNQSSIAEGDGGSSWYVYF
jgi:hypothetical protein